MSRLIATVFYVGLLRPAPGTWGSLAALPLFWALHVAGGIVLVVLATVAVFGVGLWAAIRETRDGDPDPSEIVIDEVVGQWVALWPISFGAGMMGADVLRLWPGWVAGFVLFRLFDIWKPWLVGWADRRHDPLGLMLDDVLAGLAAAFVAMAMAGIAHGVLM